MEIEDKRTVYGECTYRLVPREDEPSVCLMHDWIYLSSHTLRFILNSSAFWKGAAVGYIPKD